MHIKRNEKFILTELEKVPYLLPFGQEIAAHHLGVKLNATGVYLWNLLQKTDSYNDILTQFYTYYEASIEERPILKKDLDDFLKMLGGRGIIEVTEDEPEEREGDSHSGGRQVEIAGIRMELAFAKGLIHPSLLDFAAQSEEGGVPDLTVTLHPQMESEMEIGAIVIRTKELIVFETEDAYCIDYKTHQKAKGMELSKDGRRARIFYEMQEQDEVVTQEKPADILREEIFMALRSAFLYVAGLREKFAIHSASILYRKKAWLFSGHSGAGKSTHTALWREIAADVEDINGDLNLIGLEDGIAYVYGLPWCGTSGIYRTGKFVLGGVTFLSKGETDQLLDFPKDEQCLYLLQRMITPAWTKRMFQSNVDAAKAIAHTGIALWHLSCTKEPSAALYMKSQIDDRT